MMRTVTIFVAAALTGCASLPATTAAQQPEPGVPSVTRSIQVNAQASVARVPDRATVELAVETTAKTAQEAAAQNARAMKAVLDAVRAVGVPERNIRTRRVELSPRYNNPGPDATRSIMGYQATNQVSVRLEELDRLGAVIDAAVAAGANRVTGVRFELAEPDDAYREALRAAITRATSEARTIADALGETLGPPLEVSTGGFSPPSMPMAMESARMRTAGDFAPPVQPGEMEIQASVSIRFRLGT